MAGTSVLLSWVDIATSSEVDVDTAFLHAMLCAAMAGDIRKLRPNYGHVWPE
jgi:hypothetical protein